MEEFYSDFAPSFLRLRHYWTLSIGRLFFLRLAAGKYARLSRVRQWPMSKCIEKDGVGGAKRVGDTHTEL